MFLFLFFSLGGDSQEFRENIKKENIFLSLSKFLFLMKIIIYAEIINRLDYDALY